MTRPDPPPRWRGLDIIIVLLLAVLAWRLNEQASPCGCPCCAAGVDLGDPGR